MTTDKLIDLGIASKVTNEIFIYHVTGFLLNVTYHGNSKKITFACALTGKIFKEEVTPHYLDFEDFIETVQGFAKELHATSRPIQRLNETIWN